MEESKAPPEKIKVVDRRRFTDDGEPRQDVPPPQETTVGAGPPTSGEAVSEEPSGSPTVSDTSEQQAGPSATSAESAQTTGPDATSPGGFLELVAMLAHQAELLLHGAEGFPAQPAEARRLIDYLGALEEKTAGNLTSEESQILSNIIFQLRTLFVQSTR